MPVSKTARKTHSVLTLYSFNALFPLLLLVLIAGYVPFVYGDEYFPQQSKMGFKSVLGNRDINSKFNANLLITQKPTDVTDKDKVSEEVTESGTIPDVQDEVSQNNTHEVIRKRLNNTQVEQTTEDFVSSETVVIPEIQEGYEFVELIEQDDETYVKVYKGAGNSNVPAKAITVDRYNNKIKEESFESVPDFSVLESSRTYDLEEDAMENFRLSSADGKVDLTIRNGSEAPSNVVEYYPEKNLVTIKNTESSFNPATNNVRVMVSEKGFEIFRSGITVLSTYPVEVDASSGFIALKTDVGEKMIKAFPDEIDKKIRKERIADDYNDLELVTESGKLMYRVEAVTRQRLVGLFSVLIPSVLYFDAETGSLLERNETGVYKMLDMFSF